MNLFTFPVVVGQGTRLFPDTGRDMGARTGRIAGHPERCDDPGLSAHRAPAVRDAEG